MGTLATILYNAMLFLRWSGLIGLTIVCMVLFFSETVKSRLSPGKMMTVAGCAVLAAAVFWVLPTVINYVRIDTRIIVPDYPIGGYR